MANSLYWRRARARSHRRICCVREAPRGGNRGLGCVSACCGIGKCCACTEATGRPGRVYMMALPVWKLSVDGQQPELAPCTRSRSPRNLLRVRGSSRRLSTRAGTRTLLPCVSKSWKVWKEVNSPFGCTSSVTQKFQLRRLCGSQVMR